MATAEELRRVALTRFAAAGYGAASLQQIAEDAGVSKASVLYHFASKEVLLEAALGPAIDELEQLVQELEGVGTGAESRRRFLARFVDFLLAHRLAVYVFVSQSAALVDIPVIERANEQVGRIAAYFERHGGSMEEQMRFGIALAGAAYLLAQANQFKGEELDQDELIRPVLNRVLGEIIAPAPSAR